MNEKITLLLENTTVRVNEDTFMPEVVATVRIPYEFSDPPNPTENAEFYQDIGKQFWDLLNQHFGVEE